MAEPSRARSRGLLRAAGFGEGLSLRLRLILAASLAVAVAVVLAAGGAFFTVRHELRYQVDQSLIRSAEQLPAGHTPLELIETSQRVSQILDPAGNVFSSRGDALPVTAADRAVAQGARSQAMHDATVDKLHVRDLTVG